MKSAIITGASSGIGRALTRELSRRGYGRFALLARRRELLEEIRAELEGNGRDITVFPCDVADADAVRRAADQAWEAWGGIDLAIANAGIGYPTFARKFVFSDAAAIMRTNVEGTFSLFAAVVPRMVERGEGHFVGVASLAGFRGMPGASTYAASKAAMQSFLEASRIELRGTGVDVTTVNPGFIETPMTEKNRFRMPFLMGVDEAARVIADGIESRRRVVSFPLPMSLLMKLVRLIPPVIYDRLTSPFGKRKMDPSKVRR